MDWPKKIKEIKENLNLSTSELARKLSVAPHYIADIERGKSKNPTATLPELLLTNLGINPIWLFTDEGDMIIKAFNSSNITVAEAISLLNEIILLTNSQKEEILGYIKKLKMEKN